MNYSFILPIVFMTLQVPTLVPAVQDAPEERDPKIMLVNTEPIRTSLVNFVLQGLEMQRRSDGGAISVQEMVPQALQTIVQAKVLAQEARRRGYTAQPATIDAAIARMEQAAGGADKFAADLERTGIAQADLQRYIADQLISREMIAQDVVATLEEPTEEEITRAYTANKAFFTPQEMVHVRQILILAPHRAEEEALKDARKRAETAYARAAAGEDFGKLAAELSEGRTAASGGDIGFIRRDQMDPSFTRAAFSLAVGEISPVIQTPYGFHIIKLEERRPAGQTMPLEEARPKIVSMLKQEKLQAAIAEFTYSLEEAADIVSLGDPQLPERLTPGQ